MYRKYIENSATSSTIPYKEKNLKYESKRIQIQITGKYFKIVH
jgi:hypothetical protein